METYTNIGLLALFLALIGILAMLEHRRRTALEHYLELQNALSACLVSLQAILSSRETQAAQVAAALSQIHAAIQADTTGASESAKAQLAEAQRTTKAVKDLQDSMEESVKFDS